MFQNGMNHIMQKVKNTSEDQQLLLKLVDDIALEVQHLITTSFPGKIEHARKNDHSIEATTKSNGPLQTVANVGPLPNLPRGLPLSNHIGSSPFDTCHHLCFTRSAFYPDNDLPSLRHSSFGWYGCPDICCPKCAYNRLFNFPGYILSEVCSQLTGGPCPHGIREVTQMVPFTKSHKSSYFFNSRRDWGDNHKSFQVACHILHADDYKLEVTKAPPERPSDSYYLSSEGSWLLRCPMSHNHDHYGPLAQQRHTLWFI